MTTKKTAARIGRPIKPAHSAAAVTKWLPTRWARIGGDTISARPTDAFLKAAFRKAYKAGHSVNVYVGACGESYSMPGVSTGLIGAARDLLLPIYKVSSTACADPRDRLKAMNADRYASHRRTETGEICDLGFDQWMLQQILTTRTPSEGAPIALQPRALSVVLPHDLSAREFDKRLHAAMANASLNTWLVSPAGRAHCRLLGVAPQSMQRFTAYRFGTSTRLSPATELHLFRPRGEDANRLLGIIEQILFQHVLKIAPQGCRSWASPSQYALQPSVGGSNPVHAA